MRRFISVGLVVAFLALGAASKRTMGGPTSAVTISNTFGDPHIEGTYTIGWNFTTSAPLTVDRLGVFANDGGSLIEAHDVAIWDSQGKIVAETVVSAGDVDPLINQFRYNIVGNPVTLQAGEYTIGAYYGISDGDDDDFRVAVAEDLATIPQLKFGSSLFTAGNSLMQPTTGAGTEGYFGPNFTVVPEPASLRMATTAALGLMGYLWLRRKQGRRGSHSAVRTGST
jgi:hypothetical protein